MRSHEPASLEGGLRSTCTARDVNPIVAACACAIGLMLLSAAETQAGAPAGPPPRGGWRPVNGITLGPSAAWAGLEGSDAFAAGFDLSYFHKIHSPFFVWVAGGTRIWTGPGADPPVLPYAEVGMSLFLLLQLGVGYTAGLNSDEVPAHGIHGYAGLSIPFFFPTVGQLLYIEPYYRPTWDTAGDHDTSHEVGAMIKWLVVFRSGGGTRD